MENEFYLKLYYGFGDNLYQIPFVNAMARRYSKLYLRTPFQFLYHHLPNVEFVSGKNRLYTCKKYFDKYQFIAEKDIPPETPSLQPAYQYTQAEGINMIDSFYNDIQVPTPIDWGLKIKPEWIREAKKVIDNLDTRKKICIIKPPTNRKEWICPARNGKPEYFQELVNYYKDDYFFISVADYNNELPELDIKGINAEFNYGELELSTILALINLSDMVITGHNFVLASAIITGTPVFCIFGGYKHPNLWFAPDKMDMSKIAYVYPDPFCNCNNRKHECNKDIPVDHIINTFENFRRGLNKEKPQESNIILKEPEQIMEIVEPAPVIPALRKKNLLIIRLNHPERCAKYAHNESIYKEFNIHVLEHKSTETYNSYSNRFSSLNTFPSIGNICRPLDNEENKIKITQYCHEILDKYKIDLVVNSQPLHPYNTWMGEVCRARGIESINTEMGLDNKMLFDRRSCQYCNNNEIYQFVNKIQITNPTQLPQTTRQPQPDELTPHELCQKYNLKKDNKYLVILGQLFWDMSVKESVNRDIKTYQNYWDVILNHNRHTNIIVKPHPLYFKNNKLHSDMEFLNNYSNVTVINESLKTMFNSFDYFTAFSSTTILEGLMMRKKFATMGFHFCNNDKLVLQIRKNYKAEDLISKLNGQKVDEATLQRYLNFIFNYYMIYLESEQLYHRLTKSSEEYFSMNW